MLSRESSAFKVQPACFKAAIYKGSLIPFSIRMFVLKSLFGVVSAAISPFSTTIMRSIFLYRTSSSLCSIITTVLSVFEFISSIKEIILLPAAGSRFASGSSKRRISTSSTRIPASETRCFCPPLKAPGTLGKRFSTSTVFAASKTF